MSCYHRYGHGCYGPLPPPEWYDDYGYRARRYRDDVVVLRDDEYDDEEERPRRRRGSGRGRRCRDEKSGTEAVSASSLEDRAAALREELARVEEELAVLPEDAGPHPIE